MKATENNIILLLSKADFHGYELDQVLPCNEEELVATLSELEDAGRIRRKTLNLYSLVKNANPLTPLKAGD